MTENLSTWQHSFAEREGIAYYPDSHYIQWPELLAVADIESGAYLKSRTPEQNMAGFLVQRAECFHAIGDEEETQKAIHYARQLDPDDPRFTWLHAKRTKPILDRAESVARIQEEHQERNAGRPGHSLLCNCKPCKEIRESRKFQPTGHSQSCICKQCRDVRQKIAKSRETALHSPSCQCRNCKDARETAALPTGSFTKLPLFGLPAVARRRTHSDIPHRLPAPHRHPAPSKTKPPRTKQTRTTTAIPPEKTPARPPGLLMDPKPRRRKKCTNPN